MNTFIVYLIQFVHLCIILFVLFAPLLPQLPILILHVTFTIGLLIHWFASSDVCCLSVLESYLSGKHYTDTFIHRFISPIYNINELVLSKFIKITTILLCLLSIFKLYTSKQFRMFMVSIKENGLFNQKTLGLLK